MTKIANLVETLRQGALTRDDYRWEAADTITALCAENKRLRAVLQRVRRWGSPMVRGYIDGVLGGSARSRGALADGADSEMAKQEETA